jgi:4-diphosphocytidyl-2-C-methyl-D-erythritol kinase
LRALAPAKVNFGLRVVGRRPDGYHELESLFLPLTLADELEIELGPGPRPRVELAFEGAADGVPAGSDNLAWRAAAGFLEAAGLARRVSVRLRKEVPAAAGLGGGSSDAAAVLRGLDRLLPGTLGPEALRGLALSLGADVPFFLDPRPAIVRGVGERCEPLPSGWPPTTLLLVNPGEPLSTAAVFAAWDRAAGAPRAGRPPLEELVREAARDPEALGMLLENDLEQAALGLCPAIAKLRQGLCEAGALGVGLSGSGATVFGVFPDPVAAAAAAGHLPAAGWTRVARTEECG